MATQITKDSDVDSTYNKIVDHLKSARKEKGIKQYELAKAAGLKQNTVSEFESKKTQASTKTLIRIARALGEIIML